MRHAGLKYTVENRGRKGRKKRKRAPSRLYMAAFRSGHTNWYINCMKWFPGRLKLQMWKVPFCVFLCLRLTILRLGFWKLLKKCLFGSKWLGKNVTEVRKLRDGYINVASSLNTGNTQQSPGWKILRAINLSGLGSVLKMTSITYNIFCGKSTNIFLRIICGLRCSYEFFLGLACTETHFVS